MEGENQYRRNEIPGGRKLVLDATVSELIRAAETILLPDERKVIIRALEKIDRDRAAVDVALELKNDFGLNGRDLEEGTLKLLNTVEKFYTKKPTIHTVKTALHKTEYGRKCKVLHQKTNTLNKPDS